MAGKFELSYETGTLKSGQEIALDRRGKADKIYVS